MFESFVSMRDILTLADNDPHFFFSHWGVNWKDISSNVQNGAVQLDEH